MTQKKNNYTSGTSAARRAPASASTQKADAALPSVGLRDNKGAQPPLVALLVLLAVFVGTMLAILLYLRDAPLRPVGATAEVPIDESGEVLPEPPEYTADGILMTKLENGARMYERDGVTWLVIGGYEMILCNKDYALPEDYGDGLTAECQQAFDEMAAAAAQDKIYMWIGSGFRSYSTQAALHSGYIKKYGEAYTKSMSAEAGHSEHQTGLGIDIAGNSGYYLSEKFETTKEFAWLSAHAVEYGFILRYQKDKTWATGYIYEPWHYRYVGKDLAQLLHNSGLTVEEYVGLADAPQTDVRDSAQAGGAADDPIMIG